jgi:GNAT superfamily N-acetyltransferase
MTRLGSWWRNLQQRGVVTGVRIIVNRYIYHSHRCVITWQLLGGPPAPDHSGDIAFRLATPSDLDHLDQLEPYGRGSQGVYVKQDKDWLFVACHGDRIVATRRLSLVIRHPVVSRVITLGPRQVWGADTFCVPEYRNRGIARQLLAFAERYLANLGYKERFGTIVVTNTPSLRMHHAAGADFVSYVSYVRVLFWHRLRVSKRIPAHLLDSTKRQEAA